MIRIDGSHGEGGGQILRTALALSLVTGQPFRIERIRAGRRKPGLLHQHLTAVKAAAEIGAAKVRGHAIGSQDMTFAPRSIRTGRFHYAIGSAGSCTLVLQAILPALMVADGPSVITLEGGTHNPFAPPFDFLAQTFLPLINSMGPQVEAELERPGFYPAGGGQFHIRVSPVKTLAPLVLAERGAVQRLTACAAVSRLPLSIARRELKEVGDLLGLPPENLRPVTWENAQGPGNVLTIAVQSEALTEVFTGFGVKGIPAEKVASRTVGEVRRYLAMNVPVGPYLADQLLVPMAVAGGGRIRTLPPSRHTTTNIDIIKFFMALDCRLTTSAQGSCDIALRTGPP